MNPKLGRAIACALACGCLAFYGNTPAQQQGEQQKQEQQQDRQQQQTPADADRAAGGTTTEKPAQKDAPVAGRIPLGVSVIGTEAMAKGCRLSELVGTEVKNDKGERIGKIEEMMQQFSSLEAGNAVLPGATKTALKDLPEFQYSRA